ncbi:hypothetical protein ACQCN2_12235 [Brevibacillus ginsengisoli]|uniref:hypothetical protein n=1 Tax=Brevibacillus ginsengisoli TaxID=363854 RepID=UPI003CF49060
MILTMVILLTVVSFKDIGPLVKKKRKKELILFALLTTVNFVYAVLIQMDLQPLNPQDIVNRVAEFMHGSPQ